MSQGDRFFLKTHIEKMVSKIRRRVKEVQNWRKERLRIILLVFTFSICANIFATSLLYSLRNKILFDFSFGFSERSLIVSFVSMIGILFLYYRSSSFPFLYPKVEYFSFPMESLTETEKEKEILQKLAKHPITQEKWEKVCEKMEHAILESEMFNQAKWEKEALGHTLTKPILGGGIKIKLVLIPLYRMVKRGDKTMMKIYNVELEVKIVLKKPTHPSVIRYLRQLEKPIIPLIYDFKATFFHLIGQVI